MFRQSTVAGIAAAALLATSVLVGATGSFASGSATGTAPVDAKVAVTAVSQSPAVELPAASAAVAKPADSACARKVKVVYAGYGEGASACAAQAAR